jgi:hypothetical protein
VVGQVSPKWFISDIPGLRRKNTPIIDGNRDTKDVYKPIRRQINVNVLKNWGHVNKSLYPSSFLRLLKKGSSEYFKSKSYAKNRCAKNAVITVGYQN